MVVCPLCLPELFSLKLSPAKLIICLGLEKRWIVPISLIITAVLNFPIPFTSKSVSECGTVRTNSDKRASICSSWEAAISYCRSKFCKTNSAVLLPEILPIEVWAAWNNCCAFRVWFRLTCCCQSAISPSGPACTTWAGVGNCFKVANAVFPFQLLKTFVNSGKRISNQRMTWLPRVVICSTNRSRSKTASRSSW